MAASGGGGSGSSGRFRPDILLEDYLRKQVAREISYVLAESHGAHPNNAIGASSTLAAKAASWDLVVSSRMERTGPKKKKKKRTEKKTVVEISVGNLPRGENLIDHLSGKLSFAVSHLGKNRVRVKEEGLELWSLLSEERRKELANEAESGVLGNRLNVYELCAKIEARLRDVIRANSEWAMKVAGKDAEKLWTLMQGSEAPDDRKATKTVLWDKDLHGYLSDVTVLDNLPDGRAVLLAWDKPQKNYFHHNIKHGWDSVDLALLVQCLRAMPGLTHPDAVVDASFVGRGCCVDKAGTVRHRVCHSAQLGKEELLECAKDLRVFVARLLDKLRPLQDDRGLVDVLDHLESLLPLLKEESVLSFKDGELDKLVRRIIKQYDEMREEAAKHHVECMEAHRETRTTVNRIDERLASSAAPSTTADLLERCPNPVLELRRLTAPMDVLEEHWVAKDEAGRNLDLTKLGDAESITFVMDKDATKCVAVHVNGSPATRFTLRDCRNGHVRLEPWLVVLERHVLAGWFDLPDAVRHAASPSPSPVKVDWENCDPLWTREVLREHARNWKLTLTFTDTEVPFDHLHQRLEITDKDDVVKEKDEEGLAVAQMPAKGAADGDVDPRYQATGAPAIRKAMGDSGFGIARVDQDDVMRRLQDTRERRVVVQGSAGVGKTTMLRRIMRLWGDDETDNWWKTEFEWVVFLKMAHISDLRHVRELLYAEYGRALERTELPTGLTVTTEHARTICNWLAGHLVSCKSLLLLDGLEEVSIESLSREPGKMLWEELRLWPQVLLTSRPGRRMKFEPSEYGQYTLLGLSSESQEKFVRQFMEAEAKEGIIVDATEASNRVIGILRRNAALRAAGSAPMILEAICLVASRDEDAEELMDNMGVRLTPLFDRMVDRMFFRYYQALHPDKKLSNRIRIREKGEVQKVLCFLKRLVQRVWREGRVVFSGKDIETAMEEEDIDDEETHKKIIIAPGFLECLSGPDTTDYLSPRTSYSFSHLTLLEYFAAELLVEGAVELTDDALISYAGVFAVGKAVEARHIEVLLGFLKRMQAQVAPSEREQHFRTWARLLTEIPASDHRKLETGVDLHALVPDEQKLDVAFGAARESAWALCFEFVEAAGCKPESVIEIRSGSTLLHIASRSSNLPMCEKLIDCGADVKMADNDGYTPLHFASGAGRLDLCQLLLEKYTDVNSVGVNRITPLHLASAEGHADVCRVLLEKYTDMNSVGINRITPLHLASIGGHVDVCRVLLEHDADVNNPSINRNTPLHIASVRGHADVCRVLLEHDADVKKANNDGYTPLHIASLRGHVDVCRVLLEKYPDVNNPGINGNTPLHLASIGGHVDVCRVLLEYDADVNNPGINGNTPLHFASIEGHTDVCRVLLKHDADVNNPGINGNTPLHFALMGGHADVCLVLLEHDADMKKANNDGCTSQLIASMRGHIHTSCITTSAYVSSIPKPLNFLLFVLHPPHLPSLSFPVHSTFQHLPN